MEIIKKQDYEKKSINQERFNSSAYRLFLFAGSILSILFIFAFVIDREVYNALIHGDFYDAFMDYFNSVTHAMGRDPYGAQAIYPPLCYIIYWGMGMLMGSKAMVMFDENRTNISWEIKGLTLPMVIFLLYFLISLFIFIGLTYLFIKEKKKYRIWLIILVLASVPFMFQFERANIIFISLLGSMAFFVWKDSENKILKEFALICLALSAALKIYPAIFGLLLVKEKRYRETLRLIIYGVVCFFLPFLFIRGGFHNVIPFIKNLIYTSTIDQAQRDGFKISFSAVISFFAEKISNNSILAEQIGSKVSVGITLLGISAFPWIKKTWKSILLLTCLLAGTPNMSYVYTAVFFVIPLISFLNVHETGHDKWKYLLLFILIMFPLPVGWFRYTAFDNYYTFNRSFNSLQIGVSIFIVTLLLIAEGFYIFLKTQTSHMWLKQISIVVTLGLMVCILVSTGNKGYVKAVKSHAEKTDIVHKTLKKTSVILNGKEYVGTYKGDTINKIPNGNGVFFASKADGAFQIKGVWKDGYINGKIKIINPDSSYMSTFSEYGQLYGMITYYNANDKKISQDWYYSGKLLSSIKNQAQEMKYSEIKITSVLYPETIFKCTGTVTKTTQTFYEKNITVKGVDGGQYLFSYNNTYIDCWNSVKNVNLSVGDEVICYGIVNGSGTKNKIGMNLITSELINEKDTEKPNFTYESMMCYPYLYVNEMIELDGKVKKIQYDYVNEFIVYIIENQDNLYALKIKCNELIKAEHEIPLEWKEDVIHKVAETMPKKGERICIKGTFKGYFVDEDIKDNFFIVGPLLEYTSGPNTLYLK